jgi:hypothetical protein
VVCPFHLEDYSKTETLQQLGLRAVSGSARLLEMARARGQVRIEIRESGAIDVELSLWVHIRFLLAHSIGANAAKHGEVHLRQYLGEE